MCAKDDAYVPRDGCSSLEEVWPGANVKYVDAGHVSAYILYQKLIRCVQIIIFADKLRFLLFQKDTNRLSIL